MNPDDLNNSSEGSNGGNGGGSSNITNTGPDSKLNSASCGNAGASSKAIGGTLVDIND